MEENKPKRYDSVRAIFVTKLVTSKEFENYYRNNRSYCHLGTEKVEGAKMVKIGFVVGKEVPEGCVPMRRDELLAYDRYCEAVNMEPRPLSRITKKETEDRRGVPEIKV